MRDDLLDLNSDSSEPSSDFDYFGDPNAFESEDDEDGDDSEVEAIDLDDPDLERYNGTLDLEAAKDAEVGRTSPAELKLYPGYEFEESSSYDDSSDDGEAAARPVRTRTAAEEAALRRERLAEAERTRAAWRAARERRERIDRVRRELASREVRFVPVPVPVTVFRRIWAALNTTQEERSRGRRHSN